MQLKYTEFQNEVPSAFEKLNCRPFDLRIPVEYGYHDAPKRAVVVIGQIPADDLAERQLLSSEEARQAMFALLREAKKWAANFGDTTPYKFAFINFNSFKTYDLKDKAYRSALQASAKRVKRFIRKMKADTVFVMGDEAFSSLVPEVKQPGKKHGYLHHLKVKKKDIPVTNTIDWDYLIPSRTRSRATREQVDFSNLFAYCYRNLSTGFLGRKALSLEKLKAKPYFVDTIAKFDKLMDKLDKHVGPIAVDTETEDLTVWNNSLLTVQFSIKASKGYVIPVYHKDTPFTKKELKHVCARLRAFFGQKVRLDPNYENLRYLVMANGAFDLRILRHNLLLPFIYWPVYDVQAGDFLLEENLGPLRSMGAYSEEGGKGSGLWSLESITVRNGCTVYEEAKFSKKDRATIKNVDLHESGVIEYAAVDAQVTLGNHDIQLIQASLLKFPGEKNYLKRFLGMLLYQMSNMTHDISQMEARGNDIDGKYLLTIASKKRSPIFALRKDLIKEMYAMPSIKKANKILAKKSGQPRKGLFGAVKEPWLFDISKTDHKQLLFLKVLGLEGEEGKSGNTSLNKAFQEDYEHVPEVAAMGRLNKLNILYNTFAKGIASKISLDRDHQVDRRLRPRYGYLGVVSGRSNSFNPSLQQIPEHSKEAKIIKRMFIAKMGVIHIKYDYSAHEVRCWGIISLDEAVATAFKMVAEILRRFRIKPTKKRRAILESEGDIHKQNYAGFAGGTAADVTKEQRQESKGITFGSIYGMAAASLGLRLKKSTEDAQKLMDKFFKRFRKAGQWLKDMPKFAAEHKFAYAPTGRRRNLPGYFINNRKLLGDLDRRSTNAPIQGMASDIAFDAGRGLEEALWEMWLYLEREQELAMLPNGVMQMVHDSTKAESLYSDAIMILWIMEYCAIHGVQKQTRKFLGMKYNVDLAIEFEIGTVGDAFEKWDWTHEGLERVMRKALTDAKDVLGYEVNVEKELKGMYKMARKHHSWLSKKFPLEFEPIQRKEAE